MTSFVSVDIKTIIERRASLVNHRYALSAKEKKKGERKGQDASFFTNRAPEQRPGLYSIHIFVYNRRRMSVEFSIGQIVRLHSGGPDMTVAGWDEAKGIVSAAYYNEESGLFVVDTFWPGMLKSIEDYDGTTR